MPSRAEAIATRTAAFALGALPQGFGQARLAHGYAVRRRRRAPWVMTQRMRDGTRMALDVSDRTQAIAFLTRRYSPEIVDYIASRLPQRGTFVDVGANVGLISFAVARRRPRAAIHAFEPLARNAASWTANQRLNAAANARLESAAVAAAAGTTSFRIGGDSGAGRIADDGEVTVPVVTLDGYADVAGIAAIDVLKIDTEGAEMAVLRGAEELLRQRRIATVICELDDGHRQKLGERPDDVASLLASHGFARKPLTAVRLGRRRVETDDVAFELA